MGTTWRILAVSALLVLSSGCQKDMTSPDAPRPRIVSYAPSITQIIFDMGLGEHVVAVTGQCELPAGQDRQRVGDALAVNAELIVAARPDMVLIQMTPSSMDAVRQMDPAIRIEHFTIETLMDIASAIEQIGRLVGKDELALRKRLQFLRQLEDLRQQTAALPKPRVMFLDGTDRPGTAGAGTFIDDMITAAGGINAAGAYEGWVQVNLEQVIVAAPEIIICQASPDSAAAAKEYWSALEVLSAAQAGRVYVISDRRFTIPSTLSLDFVAKIAKLIHPTMSEEGTQP